MRHFNFVKTIEVSQNIDYLVQKYESRGFSGLEESLDGLLAQFEFLEKKSNNSSFLKRHTLNSKKKEIASVYWTHLAAIAKVDGKLSDFEKCYERALKSHCEDLYNVDLEEIL